MKITLNLQKIQVMIMIYLFGKNNYLRRQQDRVG